MRIPDNIIKRWWFQKEGGSVNAFRIAQFFANEETPHKQLFECYQNVFYHVRYSLYHKSVNEQEKETLRDLHDYTVDCMLSAILHLFGDGVYNIISKNIYKFNE